MINVDTNESLYIYTPVSISTKSREELYIYKPNKNNIKRKGVDCGGLF